MVVFLLILSLSFSSLPLTFAYHMQVDRRMCAKTCKHARGLHIWRPESDLRWLRMKGREK